MTSLSLDRHDNLTSGAASRIASGLLSTSDSRSLTFLRIVLGAVMLPHGLQKTVGWFGGYGFDATLGYFGTLGIPALFAFLAIAAESAGAVALITGFTTRIAAFGVAATITVAALMAHVQNGFFMNWSGQQKGEGFEYHIVLVAISLVLMAGGAGRFSLDRLFTRTK
ncbi:MAG TPA: DoxX family protein [Thermoanaerobaculia bacterium]|nr:DoxX family protein [Thermoanaerobaculia bacterium]